jgi:G3E family GTPase
MTIIHTNLTSTNNKQQTTNNNNHHHHHHPPHHNHHASGTRDRRRLEQLHLLSLARPEGVSAAWQLHEVMRANEVLPKGTAAAMFALFVKAHHTILVSPLEMLHADWQPYGSGAVGTSQRTALLRHVWSGI